ncbi:MAG: RNA-binding S4 domain-containing protein [Rhodospirillales bacterium]|nr:RNA-binding S4 domain-containing protein [Rhodospirillales bacterium]
MSEDSQRLDKWLWFARFFRSRSLAQRYAMSGRLRVNGVSVGKAHHAIKAGDVLTFPLGHVVRVIRIVDVGSRRGPAVEAQALYCDLAPPPPRASRPLGIAVREAGAGRPTKAERRATDRLRDRDP